MYPSIWTTMLHFDYNNLISLKYLSNVEAHLTVCGPMAKQ